MISRPTRPIFKTGTECAPCTFRLCKGWSLGCEVLDEVAARPDGSDPEDDGDGFEPDLEDETRSLLDFLNARRRRVMKSLYRTMPGLPHRIVPTKEGRLRRVRDCFSSGPGRSGMRQEIGAEAQGLLFEERSGAQRRRC